MTRNGKKFEDSSETPEEIVALLGNFGNRPDCRAVQERQVKEIKELMKKAKLEGYEEGYNNGYDNGYCSSTGEGP